MEESDGCWIPLLEKETERLSFCLYFAFLTDDTQNPIPFVFSARLSRWHVRGTSEAVLEVVWQRVCLYAVY